MDVEQKKQEVLESVASQPLNVVYIRVNICNQVQLADLMKEDFIPYLRGPANSGVRPSDSVQANDDSLHEVCIKLAKQRALLQGATASDVIHFKIDDGTATTRAAGTAPHNSMGVLSFGKLEDSDYNNKTSFGYVTLHDLNETGGSITLSSTSNANTTIVNDDGENVKYFTDFSKYFLTRSRANGEIISVDENSSPYITPTASEPFIPANTINGEIFTGTAPDPSANTDVRHEFTLTANTTGSGYVGANNDITENKYIGNTFVTIEMSGVDGAFQTMETIKDFDENSATVKSYSNTTTILLNGFSGKGTLTVGETLTDLSTNAIIESTTTVSDTETIVTLTGSTFLTGSNTDISLGFSLSNTVALDTNSVSRKGTKVTVTSEKHGISPGTRIALKGADDVYNEFNNTFVVEDTTENTLVFYTANTGTIIPTGDFNMITNIVHGVSSNASIGIQRRTTNASANVVFQSSNLSAGFPLGNVVTGSTTGAVGVIDTRTDGGTWYQTKTAEVKTFYTNSTSGTWDYDATNNPVGIESTANVGSFWNKEFEPVKINQLVASTGSGGTYVAPKVVLDIALATTSDTSGGYDDSIRTKVPGIYLAYPLKTWEDQTHDGEVTLEAYNNFANLVVAPEGLEINFDWKPLANSSVAATNWNSGTGTGDIYANGVVTTAAYHPEECTVLDEGEFNTHLGPYSGIATANSTAGFPNAQSDDILLSSIPANRARAIKVGTSGAVYPSANANPFYPAIGGTHKAIANTESDITGTQPASLTANDVYAGSYESKQKDAVEPEGDYRYVIQNDLKWCYATNPFAIGSTTAGNTYNTPGPNAHVSSIYDGYSASTIGFAANTLDPITSEDAAELGAVNQANTVSTSTLRVAAGAHTITTPSWNVSGGGSVNETSATYKLADQTISSFQGLVATRLVSGTLNPESSSGTVTYSTGALTEATCYHNFIHRMLSDGETGGSSMTTANLEPKLATLYTLLTNLIASTTAYANTAYRDPNEPSSGTQITDSVFETAVSDMKGKIDDLISAHNDNMDSIKEVSDGNFTATGTGGTANSASGICLTTTSMDVAEPWEPDGYVASPASSTEEDEFKEFKDELALFRIDLTKRITEISNRIGYLNGKDVADGGYHKSVNSLTIAGGGATYSAGTLTATGGSQETDGIDFSGTYTVDGSGTIDSVTILNPGTGYTSVPTIVISHAGDGNGSITATLSSIAKSAGNFFGYKGNIINTLASGIKNNVTNGSETSGVEIKFAGVSGSGFCFL